MYSATAQLCPNGFDARFKDLLSSACIDMPPLGCHFTLAHCSTFINFINLSGYFMNCKCYGLKRDTGLRLSLISISVMSVCPILSAVWQSFKTGKFQLCRIQNGGRCAKKNKKMNEHFSRFILDYYIA